MKKILYIVIFLLPPFLFAQFTVVSTLPSNNATNIPLTTTVSITFSEALDTNAINENGEETWFSNIDSMVSYGYSADLKTTFGTYVLKPNKMYFVAFMYVKAKSGAVITTPYVYYFTTGSAFPTPTVSGTVLSGTTGITPEKAIVGLMTQSIEKVDGQPNFAAWTNVNSNGTFTVPYVANGTYWPIAAKDADGNGTLNPENEIDVIAIGDSIVVNNASLTNIMLKFMSMAPLPYHGAVKIADSLANRYLPSDRVLRYANSWGVDTLGRGVGTWHFIYTGRGNTRVYDVPGSEFEGGVDSLRYANNLSSLLLYKQVTNWALAAPSPTAIVNAENAGGRQFRRLPVPIGAEFGIEMILGGHRTGDFYGLVPDTNQLYWTVRYRWGINQAPWILDGRKYLLNFSTGAVILSGTMSVPPHEHAPLSFDLFQNYPNPFNPSTTIDYQLPLTKHVSLKIYDAIGREVATLVNEVKEAGYHSVHFDATKFSSGIYFARLSSGGKSQIRKLVMMK